MRVRTVEEFAATEKEAKAHAGNRAAELADKMRVHRDAAFQWMQLAEEHHEAAPHAARVYRALEKYQDELREVTRKYNRIFQELAR